MSNYFFGSRNQQVPNELRIQITGLESRSPKVFKGLFASIKATFSSRNCPFLSLFICLCIKVQ